MSLSLHATIGHSLVLLAIVLCFWGLNLKPKTSEGVVLTFCAFVLTVVPCFVGGLIAFFDSLPHERDKQLCAVGGIMGTNVGLMYEVVYGGAEGWPEELLRALLAGYVGMLLCGWKVYMLDADGNGQTETPEGPEKLKDQARLE